MIFGHERQIAYLRKVLQVSRTGHAYLFSGPDMVGKRTIAMEWVRLFFCKAPDVAAFQSCGTCVPCLAITSQSHPDVIMVSPSRPLVGDPKKEIGIDTVREIKRLASFTPHEGGRRLFLIDEAEFLREESQNSLLKLLEEPALGTVFILITDTPGALLPTILSRVVPISFTPLSDTRMRMVAEQLLNGRHASAKRAIAQDVWKEAEDLSRMAAGRPGFIVRAVTDASFFETEKKAQKLVAELLEEGIVACLLRGEALAKDRDAFRHFSDRFLTCSRRALLQGPGPRVSRALKAALDIRFAALHTNASTRLAADALFLHWHLRDANAARLPS